MKYGKVVWIIVLLFLVGCGRMSPQGNAAEQGQVPITVDYRSGSEGIVVETLPNMPPEEIAINENFKIALSLHNQGATNVKDAKAIIAGLNSRYFSYPIELTTKSMNLQGKSAINPVGESALLEIDVKNTGLPMGTKKYEAPYEVGLFYEYETIATSETCINPDVYGRLKLVPEACTVGDVSLSTQGAPIAITQISTRMAKDDSFARANFVFKVSKIGQGEVVNKLIDIDSVKLANEDLICTANQIKLNENNQGEFRCHIDLNVEEGAYKTIVSAKLSYDYRITYKGKLYVKEIESLI